MVDYGNWKLNEIFNDTFPNLGWAKRMDDKPKFAGNYEGPLYARHPDLPEPGPYPDEMFEEAERREAERKALDALDELYEKNGDAMLKLAEIEKDEWERKERSDTVLRRYNHFYNEECSGLPHGTPITPEHMQAMALECMVDALICENMNVEYNVIAIDDIKDLIARLYQQSDEFLKRVQEFKDSSDGVA